MKKKDLERFKERLLSQKQQLAESARKVLHEELNVSRERPADEVDMASADFDRSMLLRLKDRERAVLPKIDKALALIDKGEYGVCEGCDGDIGVGRLEVRPFATLCIKCKEEEEHNEKMFAQS
jgi:DnaK suppressor protein